MTAGRWVASLPDIDTYEDPREHGEAVLHYLADALRLERLGSPGLISVRHAAAHVRAWRLSLPKSGQHHRQDDMTGLTNRALIRVAIRAIVNDDWFGSWHLRAAEAALRTLGKRLMAEVES